MKTLVIVDVQNEYRADISKEYKTHLCEYISDFIKDGGTVIAFYNNLYFDVDYPRELFTLFLDYSTHSLDEIEDIIVHIRTYEKTYGHFISLVDTGIGYEEAVKIIRWLIDGGDGTEDFEFGLCPEVSEVLENIIGEITLIGGYRNYCLKEIELEMIARDMDFTVYEELTY